jgi:hypothetical protein
MDQKIFNYFSRELGVLLTTTQYYDIRQLINEMEKEIEPNTASNRKELLLDFASHLNTYKGLEEIRFDFMVVDYFDKIQQ